MSEPDSKGTEAQPLIAATPKRMARRPIARVHVKGSPMSVHPISTPTPGLR